MEIIAEEDARWLAFRFNLELETWFPYLGDPSTLKAVGGA
jgi:hypothetical protein